MGRHKRSTEANTTFINATFVSFNNKVADKEHATFFKKKIPTSLNRILHGKDPYPYPYPWTTLVFNRLRKPCTTQYNDIDTQLFKNQDPDGVAYDICSGSLISNKHILTSALCILVNKNAIDSQSIFSSKKPPEYSKPECIFAIVGFTNKDEALNKFPPGISRIRNRYPHPQAFSDIQEYNYNLGRY